MAETKRRWYAPVLTEADAVQAIRETSTSFLEVAALLAVAARRGAQAAWLLHRLRSTVPRSGPATAG